MLSLDTLLEGNTQINLHVLISYNANLTLALFKPSTHGVMTWRSLESQ